MRKKETHSKYAHHATEAKGDAHYGGASPFYLTSQKVNQPNLLPLSSFPASVCPWAHVHAHIPMNTLSGRKKIRGSSKMLGIFERVVHHGFKSWSA
jgi:hypothetical protein